MFLSQWSNFDQLYQADLSRQHVFADLKPYICTFSECKDDLALFSTRKLWEEHEFSQHRVDRSWSCSECPESFPTLEQWREHLIESHRTVLNEMQLQTAARLSEKRKIQDIQTHQCPLCLIVPGKSRRNFVTHVARHMEAIALVALPPDSDPDSNPDSDSDSDSNSNSHRESIIMEKSFNAVAAFLESADNEPLEQGLQDLRDRYPGHRFEGVMRLSAVDTTTNLPCPTPPAGQPTPENIKYMYLPRIRCLDCPGKLYLPGPGMTVVNFEAHLKNRLHHEKVELHKAGS